MTSAGCSALRSSARSCPSRTAQYIGPTESRCKRGGQELRCSSAPFAGLPCVLLVCSGFRPVRRQHARCVPRPAEPRPGRSSLCMPWPHAEPWPPPAKRLRRTRYLFKLVWPGPSVGLVTCERRCEWGGTGSSVRLKVAQGAYYTACKRFCVRIRWYASRDVRYICSNCMRKW